MIGSHTQRRRRTLLSGSPTLPKHTTWRPNESLLLTFFRSAPKCR
jgi:hypothetical protein